MPSYYALIDTVPGREDLIEPKLRATKHVADVARVKEGNYDFLVRIEADGLGPVDDALTHMQRILGVKACELITDFSEHGDAVAAARAKLG